MAEPLKYVMQQVKWDKSIPFLQIISVVLWKPEYWEECNLSNGFVTIDSALSFQVTPWSSGQ